MAPCTSLDNGGKVAVFCDFDGTIARLNVGDYLYEKFSASGVEHSLRWERGEITTRQEYEFSFATITATKTEMESVLRGIAIDPGIRDLLAFCERRGYPFAITSEGLDWYVNTILEHHGIHGVRLYTSHISFDNGTFRFDFPWYDDETPSRGVCKPKILRESQSLGMKTVYIGDGISDFEAAKVAEAVYATRRLLEYCRARGIPAIPFQSLSDVVVNWKEL